jgi:hypothetical protein
METKERTEHRGGHLACTRIGPIAIRPPAVTDARSRFLSTAEVTPDVAERFLSALVEFGQVTYAANVAGMTRRSFYARRQRDPDFAQRWDEALDSFEESLTQRVIATAVHMGTGRWVPALDPITGEPELNDDFEPLLRFDCSHVDPRIAVKLIGLRVRSLNEAPVVAVQNNFGVEAPRLVAGPPIDVDALLLEYADVE